MSSHDKLWTGLVWMSQEEHTMGPGYILMRALIDTKSWWHHRDTLVVSIMFKWVAALSLFILFVLLYECSSSDVLHVGIPLQSHAHSKPFSMNMSFADEVQMFLFTYCYSLVKARRRCYKAMVSNWLRVRFSWHTDHSYIPMALSVE